MPSSMTDGSLEAGAGMDVWEQQRLWKEAPTLEGPAGSWGHSHLHLLGSLAQTETLLQYGLCTHTTLDAEAREGGFPLAQDLTKYRGHRSNSTPGMQPGVWRVGDGEWENQDKCTKRAKPSITRPQTASWVSRDQEAWALPTARTHRHQEAPRKSGVRRETPAVEG